MSLMILNSTCTVPFYRGISVIVVLDFGPRKRYPPALLSDSRYEMLEESEYIRRIILLLIHSVTESGCDAL